MINRPWWWPVLTDESWIQSIRDEHPKETMGMSDEEVRDEFADGRRYFVLWDHMGGAVDEHEQLADAFLKYHAALERIEELCEEQDIHGPIRNVVGAALEESDWLGQYHGTVHKEVGRSRPAKSWKGGE